MAPDPVSLLLLWALSLFGRAAAASLCDVTCSTDFVRTLNCSCSGSVPALPVLLNVTCSYEDTEVDGGCSIEPPHSWCAIQVELREVADIETNCTATVGHVGVQGTESFMWALSDVVKPQAPVVTVSNAAETYNVTWSNNPDFPLTYRVRIRTAADPLKDWVFLVDEEVILINHRSLQPGVLYVVDVQAKMSPGYYLQGPWSEWSSGVEWRTEVVKGINFLWLYVSMLIILILALLLLGYLHKPFCQKKLQMLTYIPRPNDYFKPLYHNYGGNFKEWMKPVFDECDYLIIQTNAIVSEKQNVIHWNDEKQSFGENEMKEGGQFLQKQQAPSNLLQNSSSSHSTIHSTGHISIHTVTLSGEEFDEEVTSQSSLRSYQDGESFGSFGEANGEHGGYNSEASLASRSNRQSGISLQRENQIANDLLMENLNFEADARFIEAERASLDSFVSNEQSEDGYPRVDLDTIDSGYGECGSPGASDSNRAEQVDSFHELKNSNYVKQWMVCSAVQEGPSDVNKELDETQSL